MLDRAPQVDRTPAWAQELAVGHVGEYFGAWAMEPKYLQAAVERVQQINLQLHVAEYREAAPRVAGGSREYAIAPGGVAVIELRGPLMKQASSFSGGTSTVRARRQIRDAAADDEVSAILLKIDSPGGTVAGAVDLGDEIARAAKQKPLDAYIEDLGASGAYWAASQARRIFTNRTGLVGSIGTYGVLVDQSGKAAQHGIKVHVVRAGDFKGAGYPGTEVSADLLGQEQALIDSLNEHFIRAVAAGRKFTLERTRELADGRIHVGQAALELGLADGIQSFDETLSNLRTKTRSAPRMSAESQAGEARTDTTREPQAASFHDLKAALPGADADFICRQMEANATTAQAQAAWLAELGRRNQTLTAERDAAAKERDEAKAAAVRPGADPLSAGRPNPSVDAADGDGDEDDDDGDSEAENRFNALVDKEEERLAKRRGEAKPGELPVRARAMINVAGKHPQLHRQLVGEANSDFANGLPRVFAADPLAGLDARKPKRGRKRA